MSELLERDEKVVWHPYTRLKNPLVNVPVVKGEKEFLIAEDGTRYIDGISSWWVNVHGHSDPYMAEKVFEQFNTLEHVIFAGFTHPRAVEVAERVLAMLPSKQSKVFFSDNGSTAVEVGVKMALQYWVNRGIEKKKVIALEGAYHGDTFGAMSVSGRSAFSAVFNDFLFDVDFIPFPDKEKEGKAIDKLKQLISSGEVAAFIFEPLVQGASGMRMYSPDILDKLMQLCQQHDVLCIADEVMTGFGRTGRMFATDYCNNKPDIYCFSKGLTGGTLPLSLTTCSQEIVEAFDSEDKMKTFFHGHSFTANPIGCAAACASMDIFERKETWENIKRIENSHRTFLDTIINTGKITNAKIMGTIISFELKTSEETSYFNAKRDGIYNFFLDRGILLRPLGNVIYILPPYCTSAKSLDKIYNAISEFLEDYNP